MEAVNTMSVEVAAFPLVGSGASRRAVSTPETRKSPSIATRLRVAMKTRRRGMNLEGVATFLRTLYPTSTAANVEADTDISARTVEGWLQLRIKPSADNVLDLTAAYGAPFLAAASPIRMSWLDDEAARANARRIDAEIEALQEKKRRLFNEGGGTGRCSG